VDVADLEVGLSPTLGPPIPTNHGPVTAPALTGQVLRWDASLAQWQPATVVPWYDVTWFGADPTGGADSTNAINAAIAEAARTGAGGVVYCPAGDYAVSRIRLRSRVTLCGQGHKTTFLQIAGTAGDMISLEADTVDKVVIRDLRLFGNKANQTSPNRGIHLHNTGGEFADFDTGDSLHIVENVFIKECKGAGFAADRRVRDLRASKVHVSACDGPGFDLVCTDSSFVSCTAGACGRGFYVRSYNTHYVACKAFGCVGGDGLPGDGFVITAVGAKFSACEAQDNWGRGFVLSGASDCALTSVAADSNGVDVPNADAVGFLLENTRNCIVVGSAWNREGESLAQHYGLEIRQRSRENIVMLTTRANVSGHVHGDVGEANWVVLNGRPWLPVVPAGDLARGGAAMNGTILIEDGDGAARNLVFYAGGRRFRVRGVAF
jgi:hypothetical protein